MATALVKFSNGLFVAALLCVFGSAGTLRAADDDAALRRKALALNDVTGDNPILGEIKALVKDEAGTRKLLPVAVAMAKEKEQPFNYNGAYILARAALQLRELDASKVFYRICAEQASKLQSAQKLREAYGGMLLIIDILNRQKKYDESLKLSQEFLETLDRQGVSSSLKAAVLRDMSRALIKQGKTEEGNRIADNLLKAKETDWRNLELKAWIQNETGHADEAFKTYEKVLSRIADDDQMEKEDKAEAQAEVAERFIRLLVKHGKADQASRVMDEILKGRKEDLSRFELKARWQEIIGRYAAAIKSYEELLERLPKDEALKENQKAKVEDEVREQIIRLLIKLGKPDDASRVVSDLLKGKKENLETLELKAQLQQMTGQYAEAAKTYEHLLERLPKEELPQGADKAKAERVVRYALSNVYVEMNRIDKATDQLKTLLAQEPDNPSYNNDLGYVWADHDQNLDEAEKLIRKALEEDRKQRNARHDEEKANGAYLDSLGWVLFKQKKYEEAKKYLVEATQADDGDNIEIYDHLADVYLALGDKAQALETWKKALTLDIKGLREQRRKEAVEKKLKANE